MDGLSFNPMPLTSELADLRAQNGALPQVEDDRAATGKKFESLLATMLVKEMRQTLSEGFFGEGPGADTFGGWLDKSIGDNLAESWDLDIAGMVKANLDAKQAKLDGAAAIDVELPR